MCRRQNNHQYKTQSLHLTWLLQHPLLSFLHLYRSMHKPVFLHKIHRRCAPPGHSEATRFRHQRSLKHVNAKSSVLSVLHSNASRSQEIDILQILRKLNWCSPLPTSSGDISVSFSTLLSWSFVFLFFLFTPSRDVVSASAQEGEVGWMMVMVE